MKIFVGETIGTAPPQIVSAVGGAVLVAGAIAGAFFLLRRRQLLADTPTSKCAGVFMGWNEVVGVAHASASTLSHFTRTPCVAWTYSIEHEYRTTTTETTTDSNGHQSSRQVTSYGWRTEEQGGESVVFEVVDDSGRVWIDPTHAKVHLRSTVDDIVGDRRHGFFIGDGPTGRIRNREQLIAVGDPIFATGVARLRDDQDAPIIDSAGDGPFVITTEGEESVRSGYKISGPLLLTVAAGVGAGASYLMAKRSNPSAPAIATLPGLAMTLVIIGLAALTLVFNGLIRVRNRCDRAFSLIDVMLQRRHDLIPRLQACVAAAANHEAATLIDVTELRTGAIPASEASSEAARQGVMITALFARAEDYPGLNTDANFLRFQRSLRDTEDRIAAAREFYNESATALRTRTDSFPGLLVNRFSDFSNRPLFAAEGFERTVPALNA